MEFSPRFALSAALVVLLAVLAERGARARAERAGIALRAPSEARRALALLLALLATVMYRHSLALSVALLLVTPLLLLPRAPRALGRIALFARPPEGALRPGHFAPLSSAQLAEADVRFVRASLLDATTARGALALLLALSALLALPDAYDLAGDPYGFALLCGLPSWFIGARLSMPRSFAERVSTLAKALRTSTLEGCALRLLAHVSEGGELAEPRARIAHQGRYPGLVRIDVLVDTRRERTPFVLCAVVGSGSLSERWLEDSPLRVARVEGRSAGRVALLWSIDDFDLGVAALFGLLDGESQRTIERIADAALPSPTRDSIHVGMKSSTNSSNVNHASPRRTALS
jgi:hypothetical protein